MNNYTEQAGSGAACDTDLSTPICIPQSGILLQTPEATGHTQTRLQSVARILAAAASRADRAGNSPALRAAAAESRA